MDKEQLKEQLIAAKAKAQEKLTQLTEMAKEGAAEAKEEIQEQIVFLKGAMSNLGEKLEELGTEASEEFGELKEKAIIGMNALKERFKDWF